jgi:hypothetical protein
MQTPPFYIISFMPYWLNPFTYLFIIFPCPAHIYSMQINIYSKITKTTTSHQPRGIRGHDIARNESHVPHSGPFLLPYIANLISRGRKGLSSRAPFRAAVMSRTSEISITGIHEILNTPPAATWRTSRGSTRGQHAPFL